MSEPNAKTILDAMQPKLLDRVINYVSPERGARRMRARALQAIAGGYMASGLGGYQGARLDRRATAGWTTTYGGSADSDALFDLPALRDRSRDLVRNNPLAAGAIGTVCQSVVGTGLAMVPKPDAEFLKMTPEEAAAWAVQTERAWRMWAESPVCDLTLTQSFYGLQDLVFRSALESGDCFALLPLVPVKGSPYRLRVQLIEADRVANPTRGVMDGGKLANGNRIFGGVEKDANGAPVAYHILREHPGSLAARGDWTADRYEAFGAKTGRRNVVHLFARLRPDQSRGVPYLAPVIEALRQLGQYTDAEIMAAVVSSLFTVFVKTPAGEGLNVTQSAAASQAGIATASTPADPTKQQALQLGNGLIVDLADGDDVQFANPGRPNQAFDGFVQAVLRQVGVALGLPFEVLVKHFTASYSAARAALLEAWKFYMGRRHWLAQGFCQPIYEGWMDDAVATGRVAAPGYFADPLVRRAYLGCDWLGDAPGSVDPLKEVLAAEKRLEIGVSTLQRETMELTGGQWEENHAQQKREHDKRLADGLISPIDAVPLATRDTGTAPPQDTGGSDLETQPGKGGN